MTTAALLAFLVIDAATDALLWPWLRARRVNHALYQGLRAAFIRLPLLAGALWLAGLGTGNGGTGNGGTGNGPLAVALCLVLVWTAAGDTAYHVVARGRIPLDGDDHDHKGPILPALASDLLGVPRMSEAAYRTAAVAAGLAVLAAALCLDVLAALDVLS